MCVQLPLSEAVMTEHNDNCSIAMLVINSCLLSGMLTGTYNIHI